MPALLLDTNPRHCSLVLASLCPCVLARHALMFLDNMRRWDILPSARASLTTALSWVCSSLS
jgi:hypothetical protein